MCLLYTRTVTKRWRSDKTTAGTYIKAGNLDKRSAGRFFFPSCVVYSYNKRYKTQRPSLPCELVDNTEQNPNII